MWQSSMIQTRNHSYRPYPLKTGRESLHAGLQTTFPLPLLAGPERGGGGVGCLISGRCTDVQLPGAEVKARSGSVMCCYLRSDDRAPGHRVTEASPITLPQLPLWASVCSDTKALETPADHSCV